MPGQLRGWNRAAASKAEGRTSVPERFDRRHHLGNHPGRGRRGFAVGPEAAAVSLGTRGKGLPSGSATGGLY
jgi:hypothetical protein